MIDVPTMYIKSQRDQTFGFKQYRINPQYLDPKKQIIQRQLQRRKKSGMKRPKPKRKPCFMDDYLRHIKFVPGPGNYPINRDLSIKSASIVKPKVDKKLKKNTYIQQIQRSHQIKTDTPSIGIYHVTKSLQQFQKQSLELSQKIIKYDQKRHALDNFELLSSQVPGAGNYNHSQPRKIKKQNRSQAHFKKKSAEQERLRRAKSAVPDFIRYQPVPQMFNTFTKTSRQSLMKKHVSRWQHGQIDKRPSSTGFLISPGPATYSLINKWQKQKLDKNSNETNKYVKLLNRVSSGYRSGIYN